MSSPLPAVAVAECIAFLEILHRTPNLPCMNLRSASLDHRDDRYQLPFDKERDLTGTLAFLSSIKYNPNRIPAVCIKEDQQQNMLELFVAVNQEKSNDGAHVLEETQVAFEKLLQIIGASYEARTDEMILYEIVSMCNQRIRERLGLSVTKKPRASLKRTCQTLAELLGRSSSSFLERVRQVIAAIDAWTGYQTTERLQVIVERFHHLSQLDGLSDMINDIPNLQMDPSLRSSFLNIVYKVARYRESARILYRMAKKFPIARRFKVHVVDLPAGHFQTLKSVSATPTLASTLTRMNGGQGNTENKTSQATVRQICRLLGPNDTNALNIQFGRKRDKILEEAKIHAEVQLIYFCDQANMQPPPRVICSSKSACFLCNLFILSHGKFYTPKSHGRLYPGWRLPSTSNLSHVETVFVARLEEQIKESVKTLLQRQKRTVYPDPNESTLLTIPVSASTVTALSVPVILPAADIDTGSKTELSSATNSSSIAVGHVESAPLAGSNSQREPPSRGPTNTSPVAPAISMLVPGDRTLIIVNANETSKLFQAWPMRLQIEFSVGKSCRTSSLTCSLTCLPPVEVYEVKQRASAKIIDVSTMKGEMKLMPSDLKELYLCAEDTLLQVCVA